MKIEYKALGVNIIVNLLLAGIKITAGIFFHAFTLAIDGIYTISDLVTDVIALVGIKIGKKRANKKHPFGYGRIFYVIELFMAIIAFLVGLFVLYISFMISYEKTPLFVILIIMGLVIVKLASAYHLDKVGKKKNSELLIVSSFESKMEAYSSLALIFIILLSQFVPLADMVGGVMVALFLIFNSIFNIKENIVFLIGVVEDNEVIRSKVQKIVDKYRVIDTKDITIMKEGPYYQVILDVKARGDVKVSSLIRTQNSIKKELKSKGLGIKFVEFHLV